MRVWCLIVATGCGFSTTVPANDGSIGGIDAAVPTASCDLDGDGACDDQTWRCGTAPEDPGADPLFGDVANEALWAHDVSLANRGRLVVAAPGTSLALGLRYDWRVDCPGADCQAQVEVGLVTSGSDRRVGCIVDRRMVDRNIEWSQSGSAMIATPTVSGTYDVRLAIAKQPACGTAWAPPGENHTIAKICIP